jgi:hypothetical protein
VGRSLNARETIFLRHRLQDSSEGDGTAFLTPFVLLGLALRSPRERDAKTGAPHPLDWNHPKRYLLFIPVLRCPALRRGAFFVAAPIGAASLRDWIGRLGRRRRVEPARPRLIILRQGEQIPVGHPVAACPAKARHLAASARKWAALSINGPCWPISPDRRHGHPRCCAGWPGWCRRGLHPRRSGNERLPRKPADFRDWHELARAVRDDPRPSVPHGRARELPVAARPFPFRQPAAASGGQDTGRTSGEAARAPGSGGNQCRSRPVVQQADRATEAPRNPAAPRSSL